MTFSTKKKFYACEARRARSESNSLMEIPSSTMLTRVLANGPVRIVTGDDGQRRTVAASPIAPLQLLLVELCVTFRFDEDAAMSPARCTNLLAYMDPELFEHLSPRGGTSTEKIQANCFGVGVEKTCVLGLSCSMFNHSPTPNAHFTFFNVYMGLETTKVIVFFTVQAVAEGEEVCFDYGCPQSPGNWFVPSVGLHKARWVRDFEASRAFLEAVRGVYRCCATEEIQDVLVQQNMLLRAEVASAADGKVEIVMPAFEDVRRELRIK